jgi:hypothetical protein
VSTPSTQSSNGTQTPRKGRRVKRVFVLQRTIKEAFQILRQRCFILLFEAEVKEEKVGGEGTMRHNMWRGKQINLSRERSPGNNPLILLEKVCWGGGKTFRSVEVQQEEKLSRVTIHSISLL